MVFMDAYSLQLYMLMGQKPGAYGGLSHGIHGCLFPSVIYAYGSKAWCLSMVAEVMVFMDAYSPQLYMLMGQKPGAYGSLSHGIHGCLFPSYDSHLVEAMFLCRGVVAALVPFIPSTAGKAASALGIFMGFGFGFRCWDDGLKS